MNLEKILDKTIEYGFYGLFFLVPLIVTPWNFELFEYNKMMLTYFLTVVIVGAWLAKMILQRRILIERTPFDIPLILFLASQILSTIFSIDRHTSLWGYYSRFHGGLFSTIAYIFLYCAFVSNFDRKKVLNSLYWLLSIGVVVSVYGILEHFGHSLSCLVFEGNFGVACWVQDVKTRVFATLGQPNWLAAWIIVLLPIPVAMTFNEDFRPKKFAKNKKIILHLLLFILFYLVLLYTKSRSALLGLGVSWLVLWGTLAFLSRKKPKALVAPFILFNLTVFLVSLLTGTEMTPSLGEILQKFAKKTQAAETVVAPTPTPIIHEVVRGGTPSYEIRKIVWKGSVDIWRNFPILGSGVETFAYSYYNFRPAEHNLVSEWDFLYNKAHNEYLNFAATTGSFGLLTHLLFIGWFTFWSLKEIKQLSNLEIKGKKGEVSPNILLSYFLNISLFAGWLSIPVTNFFGFSVVPVALLFFLFPAASVVLARVEEQESERVEKPAFAKVSAGRQHAISKTQYAGVILILFAICYLLFTLSKFWYADTLFAKAKKAEKQGDYSAAYDLSQRAVGLNPGEPLYHDTLSYAAASLAEQAFLQKQQALAEQFAFQAIAESDKALSDSPRNLNFLRTRAKDFYKLATLDKDYLLQAQTTLIRAGQLAPTDAKIFYNMGLVYLQLNQTQEAIKTLEETVEMKKNYQDARYALGLLYEQEGDIQKAIQHTEYILTYINSSVPEVRALYKKLTGKEFEMPK